MTQIDPRSPKATARTAEVGEPPRKQEPPFNWRVSVGMAIGLVVLFGVLFGLRALDIFPPKPAEDPQIAAARATLAAAPTQQAAAAVQPTLAPTQVSGPAASTPIALSTPAATGAAPALATVGSAPTIAATTALAQQSGTSTQAPSATGTQFETAPTPVATTASAEAVATVGSTPAISATAGATPPTTSVQPTPIAINLPSGLANAILQGYTNYWNIRLQAIENPDDQNIDLGTVMAGNELEGANKTLAEMRDNNEAGYSTVKHTIWIVHATDQEAVIVDRYVARTIKLDAESKAPLQSEPTIEQYSDTFQLQNIDGAWKVVREDAGELR
jgi:hypothetical protein